MTLTERMAPGHRYNQATGGGIQWHADGTVRLLDGGRVLDQGTHQTATAYDFWYTLGFRDAFPAVTHWWFGSAWTGRVRWTPPTQNLDEYTVMGYMQFIDDQAPALLWSITDEFVVQPPLPPFQVNPLNLPLRRQLAELLLGPVIETWLAGLDDPVAATAVLNQLCIDPAVAVPNTWIGVTSLVERERLDEMFPTTPVWWTLESQHAPFRQMLCTLQGLASQTAVLA